MIRRQVVVPVAPERLWEALTEPDQLAGWFGGRMEWDLHEGGAAWYRSDDGTERRGRIETIRPGRHLRFRWWPVDPSSADLGAGEAGEASEASEASEVSFLLEALDGGTRLTVQERPLPSGPTSGAQTGGPSNRRRSQAAGTAWTAWDRRLLSAWASLAPGVAAASR
jgi:uncharacterized protein YndB with AHSA1/START domain